MNQAMVDKIVNAVLYEGYILYPYRPSVKNRQRWTFGGLYPRSYSESQKGSDAWAMQTECLVQAGAHTTLQVRVRFLHLLARLVGKLDRPHTEMPKGEEPAFRVVERLQVGDRLLLSWEEAVEREQQLGDLKLATLAAGPRQCGFAFPAYRQLEPVCDLAGEVIAVLVHEQQCVAGAIEASAVPAAEGLFKVRVRVENLTPLDDAAWRGRDEALMRALVSTHTILEVRGGEFVSLLDPPAKWGGIAAACQNVGTWPVLVGESGAKDTVLSSPITLYDYPQIAPESPGDLFDGTEIDEILTLRILTLTEEEKQTAAAVDERARALLRRTEALADEQLLGLHGTFRGLRATPAEGGHE
jgi:hydrogenase maturation protease